MNIQLRKEIISTDVLVVGGGIGGMRRAVPFHATGRSGELERFPSGGNGVS